MRTGASERRQFEVASVRPALSPYQLGVEAGRAAAAGIQVAGPRLGIQTLPGGRFVASSVTVRQLIAHAFELEDYQIDGGPQWLTSDYFEVQALAGADATPAVIRSMLESLLADRFGLRFHRETRQTPVQVVTMARSDGRLGSGLRPTSPECAKQIEARKNGAADAAPPPPAQPGLPSAPRCGVVMMVGRPNGESTLLYGGMEISALLSRVSTELSAPVIDRTGLSGLFDITLDYTSQRSGAGRAPGLDATGTDAPPPLISGALEQQLGLKIERQIGPLEVLVIDALDRPAPE